MVHTFKCSLWEAFTAWSIYFEKELPGDYTGEVAITMVAVDLATKESALDEKMFAATPPIFFEHAKTIGQLITSDDLGSRSFTFEQEIDKDKSRI